MHASDNAFQATVRAATLALGFLLLSARSSSAQQHAICTGADCALTPDQGHTPTAGIDRARQELGDALRQVMTALAGFSSDGSAIRSSIELLRTALDAWDAAVGTAGGVRAATERPGDAPTFAPTIYAAGFAALVRGAHRDAVEELRRAAALDPLSADAGPATDSLAQGRAALRREDLPTALRHFRYGVQLAPELSETHRALGTAYWADGQADLTIEEFKAAIRANRRDERSWIALSEMLAAGGRLTEAEQTLVEAVKLFPNSGQAHYNLGRLYEAAGKYPEGVGQLEEAAALNPLLGRESLYEAIGNIYIVQADFDHAAEAHTKRIEANPLSAEAHRKLGAARVRQDRNDEALADFAAALAIDPRSAEAYAAAAQVHLRTGLYAEAAEAARQALALDPAIKEARYVLGTALMRLGQVDEGSRQIEEFRRLQTEASAAAHRQYELERLKHDAAVSLARSEYENATGLLRQAVALEPTSAPIHLALGFALLAAGHYPESVANLQKAAQLGPGPDAHRYLAEAYRALGRPQESRAEADVYRQMAERLKIDRLRKMNGNP
jgi:tetratricopeptide (TPR) repeat protein